MNEDKNSCKVYLARPCQFTSSFSCENKYWTSHRFSEEIIKSYEESLDYLKNKVEAKNEEKRVELISYLEKHKTEIIDYDRRKKQEK